MTQAQELESARRLEGEFKWADAAAEYERILGSRTGSESAKADLHEKEGYALFRAAFQAESAAAYRKLLDQAKAAYGQAVSGFAASGAKGEEEYLRALMDWTEFFSTKDRDQGISISRRASAHLEEAIQLSKMANDTELERRARLARLEVAFWLTWYLDEPATGLPFCKAEASQADSTISFAEQHQDQLLESVARIARSLYSIVPLELGWDYSPEAGTEADKIHEQVSEAKAKLDSSGDLYLRVFGDSMALVGLSESRSSLALAREALGAAKLLHDGRFELQVAQQLMYYLRWVLTGSDDPDQVEELFRESLDTLEEIERLEPRLPFKRASLSRALALGEAAAIHTFVSLTKSSAEEKKELLERAIEFGLAGFSLSDVSMMRGLVGFQVSSAFANLAAIEGDRDRRRELLKSSAEYSEIQREAMRTAMPGHVWNSGIARVNLARTLNELASLEENNDEKVKLLRTAVEESTEGIDLCLKWHELNPNPLMLLRLGTFAEVLPKALATLESLGVRDTKRSSEQAFGEIAKLYLDGSSSARAAEMLWRLGDWQNSRGEYARAAESFEKAAEYYDEAIASHPKLSSVYGDYAAYMKAWAHISRAQSMHQKEDYRSASESYSLASKALSGTKRWASLKENFDALEALETGEELSRKGKLVEAARSFARSEELFAKAGSEIGRMVSEAATAGEKERLGRLLGSIPARKMYSQARSALESARMADVAGDESAARERYDSALEALSRVVVNLPSEDDRREIELTMLLTKAWKKMSGAEGEFSPDRYTQAADLFVEARGKATREKLALLCQGNSQFCRALASTAAYKLDRNLEAYSTAKVSMGNAADSYTLAGYENEANWAKATQRLLDAYFYIDAAQKETDPEKRTRQYSLSEKALESASELLGRAGYSARKSFVDRLLAETREEKKFALSLAEVVVAPSLLNSTAAITTPTPNSESPLGLERFEGAEVQSSLFLSKKDIRVGEPLPIEIEMVNMGRAPALLTRIEEMIPIGFELVSMPAHCRASGTTLELRNKRLDALRSEELGLVLRPTAKGRYLVGPKLFFVDHLGHKRMQEPEAVEVEVKELGLAGWIKG